MAVNNSLARTQAQGRLSLSAYITQDAVKNHINNVIGGKNGTRFISSVVSAVTANPQLRECTNQSILSAALLGESLNLSPSPQLGQFYMVPFNDRNQGTVAQFILGYRGLIQLAIRSGQYRKLNVLAIKAGELIRFDPLNEEIEVKLIEDEEERENAPTIGYYAMFEYTNGFRKAIYWSRKKMEAHALKYSSGYRAKKGFTFWEKDFDAMAYKTMLRHIISRWGIMSIEMQSAIESDMAVIREDGSKIYVDNSPEDPAPVMEEKPQEEHQERPEEPKEEPKPRAEKAEKKQKEQPKPEPKKEPEAAADLPQGFMAEPEDPMAALFG